MSCRNFYVLDVMQRELEEGRGVDLVLIDFIMINMNGPKTVQKEVGFTGPVISITGNALSEDIAFFKAHEANSVITKPLTNSKLLDAIGLLHRLRYCLCGCIYTAKSFAWTTVMPYFQRISYT